MENLNDKIARLLNKVELTDSDKAWLLKYLESSDTRHLYNLMEQQFKDERDQPDQLDPVIAKEMLQNIHERIGVVKRINKASIIKMWALKIGVASLIGSLVIGTYTLLKIETKIEVVKSHNYRKSGSPNIEPGEHKAILTLADGSSIVLEDKQDGTLTEQGNTKVLKVNGRLVYNPINGNTKNVLYNTLTIPYGGQYQIELPDRSLVWLNSGSSLHFPTAFIGPERRVEVKGEAYFEVVKNTAMPFKVKVNDAEIRVLGTHFNVMAYANETALKTTLLEGQVKFVHGNVNRILKPGQETQLTKNGEVKVISGVDVDEVVAWKNGMFDFEGADLISVAKQLSRRYGVDFVFDKQIDERFYAKMPRDTKLEDVLKALELTGKARFEIRGKKIIVKPQS